MQTDEFRSTRVRTVLVCDDREELREAIGLVLSDVPRFVVVGEAIDADSCLQRVREARPDVLILDVSMPGGGPSVATAAKEIKPDLHIVVFSGRQDARVQREMLGAGADQYVVKTGRLRPLLEALNQAFADGMMVGTGGSAPAADLTSDGPVGSV
jgi:DNA-binding NarL/FixJ family response regulator